MVAQQPLPVLLTRPRAQSEAFAATLPAPLAPVIAPLLDIRDLPDLRPADPGHTLIFTSANGVAAYGRLGPGAGQAALCVGDRTAQAARAAGFEAVSAQGSADEVVALAAGMAGPFTHVRGAHARGEIAARLRALGKQIDERIAYDQHPCALTDRGRETLAQTCLVPLFSPRTAELFVNACPTAPRAHLICMSPAVSKIVINQLFAGVETLTHPTAEAMRATLLAHAAGYDLEGNKSSG